MSNVAKTVFVAGLAARLHACGAGRRRRGFSLLETLIALGLLGIGMVMIASAFPVGLRLTDQTIIDTRGSMVAANVMAILKMQRSLTYIIPGTGSDIQWQDQATPPYSGGSALYPNTNASTRATSAITQCFLEKVVDNSGTEQAITVPGSSRNFMASQVQYLHDHDGTATVQSGLWATYPFLHRKPASATEKSILAAGPSSDPATQARYLWAANNNRVAASLEISTQVLNGSGICKADPMQSATVAFPGYPRPAMFNDVNNTNNALYWFPLSDRIDRTDVTYLTDQEHNLVAGGRYLAQVFYRQVARQPAMYEVTIAVQRAGDTRPFHNLYIKNKGIADANFKNKWRPLWADANNVWKLQGWTLVRPVAGQPVGYFRGIDESYQPGNSPSDTDSNVECLNVCEAAFGRIKLHQVQVAADGTLTSQGSATDGNAKFSDKLNAASGGYMIDTATGIALRVIGPAAADGLSIRVALDDQANWAAGSTRTMWAVPSCVAVYKSVVSK